MKRRLDYFERIAIFICALIIALVVSLWVGVSLDHAGVDGEVITVAVISGFLATLFFLYRRFVRFVK